MDIEYEVVFDAEPAGLSRLLNKKAADGFAPIAAVAGKHGTDGLWIILRRSQNEPPLNMVSMEATRSYSLEDEISRGELGWQAYSRLKQSGITKYSELVKMSAYDIMKSPGCGRGVVRIVREALRRRGADIRIE